MLTETQWRAERLAQRARLAGALYMVTGTNRHRMAFARLAAKCHELGGRISSRRIA